MYYYYYKYMLQGWALYAEDLGIDMGMYTEKYSLYVTIKQLQNHSMYESGSIDI